MLFRPRDIQVEIKKQVRFALYKRLYSHNFKIHVKYSPHKTRGWNFLVSISDFQRKKIYYPAYHAVLGVPELIDSNWGILTAGSPSPYPRHRIARQDLRTWAWQVAEAYYVRRHDRGD